MVPLPSLLTFALLFPSSADMLSRSLRALLVEAQQWAQDFPLSLGQALVGQEAIQQLAWAEPFQQLVRTAGSAPFPSEHLNNFHLLKDDPVDSGVLWTIYHARVKSSGQEVALKLLRKFPDHGWLTERDRDLYRHLVEYTHNECLLATEVHKNSAYDEGGGKALSQCVIDGTSGGPPSMPLYIAMEWGGPSLSVFWAAHKLYDGPTTNAKMLRQIGQQMMMGLRCMSNPKAEVQWVHHNLNPDNIRVLRWPVAYEIELRITSFGDALSSQRLDGLSGSNSWFRPPEFAGLKPLVGFSPPLHSYDMYSAALTLLTLLSGTSLPEFYFAAFLTNLIKNAELYMPTRIASCILEKTPAKDDFQTFIDSWERCVTKVEQTTNFAEELEKVLEPWRSADSEVERKLELTKLLTCVRVKERGEYTVRPTYLATAVVAAWVETSFDKVLLSMLDKEPVNRPTPEQVLESDWFTSERGYSGPVESIKCAPGILEASKKQLVEMASSLIISVYALIVTGALAVFCCFGGTVCSACRSTPSARWIGLVIATFLLGGAVASSIWLSSGAVTLLEVLGFILGLVLVASGCMAAGSAPPWPAKLAYHVSLVCALIFCVGLFVGLRAHAGDLLSVTGYVRSHETDLEATLEDKSKLVLTALEALEVWVWFSFYPPIVGTMVCCFGLWRAFLHAQQERRVSQAVPAPSVEMQGRNP